MPDLDPNFRPGDRLTADTINAIITAQQEPAIRARSAQGIVVRQGLRGQVQMALEDRRPLLIRLTANGSLGLHNWKDVVWDVPTSAYISGSQKGNDTIGDSAYELQGLNCPLGDEIFQAWRDDTGRLLFEAKIIHGMTASNFLAGSLAAPTSGTVTAWSYNGGTLASSGLGVTGTHTWNAAVAINKHIKLVPYAGKWFTDLSDC